MPPIASRQMSPRSRRHRLALALAALALVPSLGGCVAAALAVPVAAAAGIIGKNVRVRAATPVPARRDAALADARSNPRVTLTTLTELPAPSIAGTPLDPWLPFVDYALARAGDTDNTQSALLAPGAASSLAEQRLACTERQPAVIVDLDNGPAAFAPNGAIVPSPGLAEGLARLREADIVVLWLSQTSANSVREVADALQQSGLDPAGRDPLLLMRNAADRKQTLRLEANLDVCVIAIAGDRRADFDELFDYLRNPDSALGLDGMIGSGWFLAPVPLGPPPAP
ncbi:MAG TPA: hypothetical protein VFS49_05535 [Croceibacterium sp.]|nr:hypothetical protein [Croceibacterium sp.]